MTLPDIRPPEGWSDKSMKIYTAATPGQAGMAANVVFSQEPQVDGATVEARLADFSAARHAEMQQALPSPLFHVVRQTVIEGHPAREFIVSWQNGPLRVTQWIVLLEGRDGMVVNGTATATEKEFNDAREVFEELFAQAARQL
ncbi:DcrB-related protein [Vannielia litorea]|uniref:Uncharacterized protein n=1 Tax=Vannielia litorea TaxID=1217970 RepID=A0A1N6ICX5_9RHOB|nr:DcrB-related protein [Vannielia litorea]SIO29862.1 hypothetical protein SAMN05444002_3715 [Vannielia litorea]